MDGDGTTPGAGSARAGSSRSPASDGAPGGQTGSATGGGAPVVEMDDVVLRFGGVSALDGVTFAVEPGELFAIIGPNGAGKTSIFNCLSGVYRPQQGEVRFLGQSVRGLSPVKIAKLGMGRTFQNLGLFMNLTLVDNLMLGRHSLMRSGFLAGMVWWGRTRREELANRARVEEVVDLLELGDHRGQPVGLLPYGIQKRIELGRALAMEPKVLLLDEPVAGMNVEETEDMARYILQVRDELSLAMVLVEHDMTMVMDLADRVMALDFGVPIATGSPREIQTNQDVIDAYLGGAPTGVVEGLA